MNNYQHKSGAKKLKEKRERLNEDQIRFAARFKINVKSLTLLVYYK